MRSDTPVPAVEKPDTAARAIAGTGYGTRRDDAAPRGTGRVAVVAESTCCLPPELAARYGIGIVPIPFVFGAETYLDGVDLSAAQFYEKLAATRLPPKTSPPAPGDYLHAWEEAAAAAEAVVAVTVDSKISTLQRSALLARDLAPEMLPGVAIEIVDSLSAGMGQGFVTLAAARAAAAGASPAEVAAAARAVSRRVQLIVTLETLEYLARASRLPQVAAWVGALLSIKPIVQIAGGDIHLLARVRTRRRSIERLFECLCERVPATARLHIAVQHARAAREAAALEERIRATFSCVELLTTEFTPVMGGYCGPGLLGVAFYTEPEGESRTEAGAMTAPADTSGDADSRGWDVTGGSLSQQRDVTGVSLSSRRRVTDGAAAREGNGYGVA